MGHATTDWVMQYLDLLQVEHAEPSLAALTRVTRAQVLGVPFENITSILRRAAQGDGAVGPLDAEATLRRWRRGEGGGVCFEVVAMFDRLLTGLGYLTYPVLARISFPGSHQANLVELDGERYLVDVGNGAPFLEPIPLHGQVEVRQAGLGWRFHADAAPDAPGQAVRGRALQDRRDDDVANAWVRERDTPDAAARDVAHAWVQERDIDGAAARDVAQAWVQDRDIDGAWVPFCHYSLAPADPRVRETAYQQHHAVGQSWVVDNLVLTRSAADEVWSLRDSELRHFTADTRTVETIADPQAYSRLAADLFGVPALPIDAARAALARRKVATS
jgi:arylamine N-acetyltransferase